MRAALMESAKELEETVYYVSQTNEYDGEAGTGDVIKCVWERVRGGVDKQTAVWVRAAATDPHRRGRRLM